MIFCLPGNASSRFRCHLLCTAIMCITILGSCSSGMQSLKGTDRVFLEPGFWESAEAQFGDAGGGFWLRSKATSIKYDAGNWYITEEHHYQLVVIDAEALEEYANWRIPFGYSSRVPSIKARTITSGGEIIPVASDAIYEKALVADFMLYSDSKEKVFAMPAFSDHCVLDIRYMRETQVFGLPDDYFSFGHELPVKKAVYSYSVDSRLMSMGFKIYYKTYNIEARPTYTDYEAIHGMMQQVTWEIMNISPYPDEDYMPAREDYIPRLALAGFGPADDSKDWGVFTRWYSEILPAFDKPFPGIDDLAAEVAGGSTDDVESIQKIVDFVGDRIRYVSIGLEDSGMRPHSPADVLESGYGDCKDMSCLVVAMLRSLGIEAYPALMLTRNAGTADTEFVLWGAFNHMIVYSPAGGRDLWIDPTAAPFEVGYLPPVDRDANALVIRGQDGLWKRTPASSGMGSMRSSNSFLRLESDGSLGGKTTVSYRGDIGYEVASWLSSMSKSERQTAIEREIRSLCSGIDISACNLTVLERRIGSVSVESDLHKESAGVDLDNEFVLRVDFIRPWIWEFAELPTAHKRKFPLMFPFRHMESDTVSIELPEGWRLAKLPRAVKTDSDYGVCSMQCSYSQERVVIVYTSGFKSLQFTAGDFDDFVAFWTEAKQNLSLDLILKKI